MAKINKTELVWSGKYDADGVRVEAPRVRLPFQVIETINESRSDREERKGLLPGLVYGTYAGNEGDTLAKGWKNKLIWGDNLLVMSALLEKFAGKIDLIYIDPPFATGADFSFTSQVGDTDEQITKQASAIEEKAYRDTWGRGMDSFITMIYQRLSLMRELLSANGSIYVHCDWRVNAYIRLAMDEIFGRDNFRNEIIWSYRSGGASKKECLPKKHDSIFFYSKDESFQINAKYERQYLEKPFMDTKQDSKGRYYVDTIIRDVVEGLIISPEGEQLKEFNTRPVLNLSKERLNYPTQKPSGLLQLLIELSTGEGDLVADFFCGSGTTLAVAEKLGRRWIGCDLGRWGVHVTRKRLLGIPNCKPFEVLNLGKYERQHWQTVTFAGGRKPPDELAIYEYLAFILKLYKAEPLSGMLYLHGKKGKAMIHIGSIDSPVTFDQISAALEECISAKQKELHILGWEWEMGSNTTTLKSLAKDKGVTLQLRQIPREVMEQQAADSGDVRFFELAYLEAEASVKKREARIAIKHFGFPERITDEEVRGKIETWADCIDYWAIDWNFQNDTFMQGYVAYRTRRDRALPLTSDKHIYEKPGVYRALIKVIDIFGNDTSQELAVTIK